MAIDDYYYDRCSSCHYDDTATCNGCHIHGSYVLIASPDKSVYEPGEEVVINFEGGRKYGWVRGMITDHDNTEIGRKTGPTFSGDDGGNQVEFPMVFRGYAPGEAGSYDWKVVYFGNEEGVGHSEIDLPFTIEVGSTADLAVDLIPETTPMFFGSGGGTINLDVELVNTTAYPVPFDGWIDVTLPNGHSYGPVLGPVSATIPAGGSTTRSFSIDLPGGAPAGVYSLHAKVGDYGQDIIFDADSFAFVKE